MDGSKQEWLWGLAFWGKNLQTWSWALDSTKSNETIEMELTAFKSKFEKGTEGTIILAVLMTDLVQGHGLVKEAFMNTTFIELMNFSPYNLCSDSVNGGKFVWFYSRVVHELSKKIFWVFQTYS